MNNRTIQQDKTPSLKAWLILGLLGLVWGSSYILIKKGLVAFSPVQLACLRISISAIAFLPFFLAKLKTVDWSKRKELAIVGIMGSGIPPFMFAFAQTEISSSVAGVLSSLTPLFTLLLGILFFNSKLIWSKVIGVLVGLMGAIFLILFGSSAGIEGNLWYGLLVVLGAICYAISVNTIEKHLHSMDALIVSATTFIIVGIPSTIFLFFTGFIKVLQTHPDAWSSLGYIVILSLIGTVIATILFFGLVQITNAVFSSTVSYIVPIVAIFWGAADGEVITVFHLLGMALILAGVYLSRK